MTKYIVDYTSNNSGGRWPLEDKDWYNLENAGWHVKWIAKKKTTFSRDKGGKRFLGALASEAILVIEANVPIVAEKIAIDNWESIT